MKYLHICYNAPGDFQLTRFPTLLGIKQIPALAFRVTNGLTKLWAQALCRHNTNEEEKILKFYYLQGTEVRQSSGQGISFNSTKTKKPLSNQMEKSFSLVQH